MTDEKKERGSPPVGGPAVTAKRLIVTPVKSRKAQLRSSYLEDSLAVIADDAKLASRAFRVLVVHCQRLHPREGEKKQIGNLLETYGPTEPSLSRCAALLFALAVIDRDLWQDLTGINKMRNKYAHVKCRYSIDQEPELTAIVVNMQHYVHNRAALEQYGPGLAYMALANAFHTHLESLAALSPTHSSRA